MTGNDIKIIDSIFLMKSVLFVDGALELTFGSHDATDGRVIFDHVRSFIFFKEGDFYPDLKRYELTAIFVGSEQSVGVFRVERNPLLQSLLKGRLDAERPSYFWVSTPDECLEVVSFSDPLLVPAWSSSSRTSANRSE